jgi:hypothetical protein
MICVTTGSTILMGPSDWDYRAVLELLVKAGYDLRDEQLWGPDGTEYEFLHDEEPQEAARLGGISILPVLVENEQTPEGKFRDAQIFTLEEDHAILAYTYADIPPAPEPEPEPKQTEFTRLEFLNKFTPTEQVALKSAEASSPAVGVFWESWRAAEFVRTDDPRTIGAIDMLVGFNIVTQERADEILGR